MNIRKALTAPIIIIAMFSFNTQAEDTIEVEPGLYAYSSVININGRSLPQEPYEYCLFEGINSRTFAEIIAEISGDGNCNVTNAQFGSGQATADISCPTTELSFAMAGKVTGNYTATSYSTTTTMRSPLGGPEVIVKTTARRTIACPADWTPHEGISHK